MKKYLVTFILCLSCSFVSASELTIEEQYEIINNYMYVTGQMNRSQSTAYADDNLVSEIGVKCGMSAVADFQKNFTKFDSHILKTSGVQLVDRPDFLTDSTVSPSGKFLIHYTTAGDHAVYSNVAGGSAGYVDSVAQIFDDVYDHIVNTLGYPEPLHDSSYATGGDEKYDVYLLDFDGPYYGLAYADSLIETVDGDSLATSFLELENDFDKLSKYVNRPLDAVRVTAAHEFFHMVQFAIDFSESEMVSNAVGGKAWMEMSAVWMEEEIYDNINDYYIYLPFFFNDPTASIQQFQGPGDLHPYASAIFPMFLSQKFDRDIVKSIWTKCGEYGPGPHFLQVVGEVIDSATSGAESYETAFGEFALWNYFTGSRAGLAPEGVGYEERNNYIPEFTEELEGGTIEVEFNYPKIAFANDNPLLPDHNGTFYLTLLHMDKLTELYACIDSTIIIDTVVVAIDTTFDTTIVCHDSTTVLDFILSLDVGFANPWAGSILYRDKDILDSIIIDTLLYPAGAAIGMKLTNPSEYSSITLIFSPASTNRQFYSPPNVYSIAYGILNTLDPDSLNPNAPTSIFYPYPNPAVVNKMSDKVINFKFQYATDSVGIPVNLTDVLIGEPYMIVDLFNLNGEFIRTLDKISSIKSERLTGNITTEWDMKNQSGEEVASGVYLAYARIYDGDIDGELLVEMRTKLAVIR